ncbi:hypothetical protein [Arachidicoccus soli]|uniref:Uncharacterized protein n=1 Tax=Arachidicoccus soli TaxID=2341117 RepID=A0A386HQI7_9BACT|nr:hypothetical protein [Arachidicoccus soli]AYD47952.1 hypothetical protein D6B99_10325 [Arachidicoccus soli]
METYLIELTNNRAYRLLQDLEDLKIIKVLKREKEEKQEVPKSRTARFRGALALTNEQYQNFQKHAKEIRNEWPESI